MKGERRMNDDDLSLTIFGCFRYSLGRMTYMPSLVVNVIKENKHIFNQYDWERFIQEIDECKNLGMECDKQTWYELKRFANEMLKGEKG